MSSTSSMPTSAAVRLQQGHLTSGRVTSWTSQYLLMQKWWKLWQQTRAKTASLLFVRLSWQIAQVGSDIAANDKQPGKLGRRHSSNYLDQCSIVFKLASLLLGCYNSQINDQTNAVFQKRFRTKTDQHCSKSGRPTAE